MEKETQQDEINQEAPKVNFNNLFTEEAIPKQEEVKEKSSRKTTKKVESTTQEEQASLEKPKEETQETKEEAGVFSDKGDVEEVEKIKKRLKDSQSWGRKVKQEYAYTKKGVTAALKEFLEDGKIFEEDLEAVLKLFDAQIEEEKEEKQTQEEEHPFIKLKTNLDNEFKAFKKYAKIPDAEEKYNAFFSFLAWDSDKEKEKFIALMEQEDPAEVISHIMEEGAELYEYLYKGINTSGGLRPYVKQLHRNKESLEEKVKTMNEEIKKLKQELDTNTGIVYAKSMNSRASTYQPLPSSNKGRFNELFGG